jgi:hypothetical protein
MSVKVHEAYALDSQQDRLLWWDDFLGDQLKDEWRVSGTAAVVDAQTGGIVRITTGALTNNSAFIDWNNIRSLHVTKKATMEVRAKLNQTITGYFILSLFFDVSNRIEFHFDTSAGHTEWRIYARDGGIITQFDSGISPDTSYHIFRIECHTHGSNHIHFYIDGLETTNSPITTNVPDDAGDYLQPFLWAQTRENAAKSIDIDYVVVRQEI